MDSWHRLWIQLLSHCEGWAFLTLSLKSPLGQHLSDLGSWLQKWHSTVSSREPLICKEFGIVSNLDITHYFYSKFFPISSLYVRFRLWCMLVWYFPSAFGNSFSREGLISCHPLWYSSIHIMIGYTGSMIWTVCQEQSAISGNN